jgi:hypothetical protein
MQIELANRRKIRMKYALILLIFLIIASAEATQYCSNQSATSSVFVQYMNSTPALSAEVTIILWNGTSDVMLNMGSGIYNYTFITPIWDIATSNTYYHYYNSSNPTASGAEEFIISENCSMTSTVIEVSSLFSAIIILPLVFGFVLLAGAFMFGDDHAVLKIFLFLLAYCMMFVSLWFAEQTLIKYLQFTELQSSIGTVTWIVGIVFFVLLAYILIHAFIVATQVAAQDKKARLEY